MITQCQSKTMFLPDFIIYPLNKVKFKNPVPPHKSVLLPGQTVLHFDGVVRVSLIVRYFSFGTHRHVSFCGNEKKTHIAH